MASFVKHLFCYFLLMLLSSSLIHARESKFFSKFTHLSTTRNSAQQPISSSPIEAPTLAPVEAPAPVETLAPAPEPTAFTTATAVNENQLFEEEFEGGNYEKEYQNSNYNNNGYTTTRSNNYNNNGYTTNYNNNNNNYDGFKLSKQSESHETANQNNYNTYTGNYNNNNNGYTTNYNNNNGYELASTGNYNNNNNGYTNNYNNNDNAYEAAQRQGMSDTRFVDGGKYYYGAKNENNYYPATGYSTEQVSSQNQVNYRNSVNTNTNEFNTVEFDQNQELYDENQESLP